MNTAIKRSRFLKHGILAITLMTGAYIAQSTSFSSNAATLATSDATVQVKRSDVPTVSKLWSDYEAVFVEQEKAIHQAVAEIETVTAEIDMLVAAIDRDMSNFLVMEATSDSSSVSVQLGLVTPY